MKRSVFRLLPAMLIFTLMIVSFAGCAGTEAAPEPARTPEQNEQRNREMLEAEFESLVNIRLIGEFEGLRGKLENYFLEDANGETLGKVTIDAATREIVSICYFQDVTDSGIPELSLEELRAIALDYLASWGYVLDDGYSLEGEELNPAINYGPGAEEKTYDYRVTWRRMAGGFEVADDACEVTIDPYNARVISCHFPSLRKEEAEDIAENADVISEEEAIEAAKQECPSPEEWQETSLGGHAGMETELEVSIDARKLVKTSGQEPPVVWVVEIMYEVYPPGVEHDGGNAIDHQGYFIEFDATNGEIVSTDMCQ